MKKKRRFVVCIVVGVLLVLAFTIFIFGVLHRKGSFRIKEGANILWYNQPSAEFFAGEKQRSYYSFLSKNMDICIAAYDHNLKEFLKTTIIQEHIGSLDDHAAPSMIIVNNGIEKGKIIVAYSHHDSPLFIQRSMNAEDITEFEDKIVIDSGECTYPRMSYLDDGSIIVIYRKQIGNTDVLPKRTETLFYSRSFNNGKDWTEPVKIIDIESGEWVYAGPITTCKNNIYIAFGLYSPEKERIKDVRFFTFNVETAKGGFGNSFTELPISIDNTELIYKTIEKEQEDRVWDIKIIDEIPEISFSSTIQDVCTLHVARLVNEKWVISDVAEGGMMYYPAGIVIDEKDLNNVTIGVMHNGISEIEEWTTRDFKTWEREKTITNNSNINQFRPQYVKNYNKEFRYIWLSGEVYNKWTDFDTDLNCYME